VSDVGNFSIVMNTYEDSSFLISQNVFEVPNRIYVEVAFEDPDMMIPDTWYIHVRVVIFMLYDSQHVVHSCESFIFMFYDSRHVVYSCESFVVFLFDHTVFNLRIGLQSTKGDGRKFSKAGGGE